MSEKIPSYYKGKNGYMAKDVVWNFDLSYNVGTAVTYLLRAKKKHSTPQECIEKAIAHLEFELENLKQSNQDTLDRINKKLFNNEDTSCKDCKCKTKSKQS